MISDRELSHSQLVSSGTINKTDVKSSASELCVNIRKMHFAAMAALLNIVALGMVSAFTAPTTVDMRQPGSRFQNITNSQISWIASLPGIASIFGNLLAGKY